MAAESSASVCNRWRIGVVGLKSTPARSFLWGRFRLEFAPIVAGLSDNGAYPHPPANELTVGTA